MQKIFSWQPLLAYGTLTAIVRIVMGVFMIYHGWEVFNKEPIDTYTGWLTDMHFPQPHYWALLGKGIELVGGCFLLPGFLTRFITIPLMLDMLFIVFVLGHGKIFYEDQYPLLFFLFFMYLFLAGAGKWSIDETVVQKLSAKDA